MTDSELVKEVRSQWNLMVSVATGGPRIDAVNDEYVDRRARIAEGLAPRQIEDPNPHVDLWDWYGRWSSGDLPSWQSRREYVQDMYKRLLDALTDRSQHTLRDRIAPTGWALVDRQLAKVWDALAAGQNEEDFQSVGLVCREVLISLGQTVFDPRRHAGPDDTRPSDTDAQKLIQAFIGAELPGPSNEEARRHTKAALSLAVALQHRRTATRTEAALCAEATTSVVNIASIISGRREVARASSI